MRNIYTLCPLFLFWALLVTFSPIAAQNPYVYQVEIQNDTLVAGDLLLAGDSALQFVKQVDLLGVPGKLPWQERDSWHKIKKDPQSQLISKLLILYPDGQIKESFTYTYNAQGDVKSCIIHRKELNVVDVISFEYNRWGDISHRNIRWHDGSITQEYFLYTQERVISHRLFYRNQEPYQMITYYKL